MVQGPAVGRELPPSPGDGGPGSSDFLNPRSGGSYRQRDVFPLPLLGPRSDAPASVCRAVRRRRLRLQHS
eukprot:7160823-Pyramimonas_sp.AAC.1